MHQDPSPSAAAPALDKSLAERFFQSLLFEIIAIALCAGLGAWLLGYSLVHMGALTVMISTIAMLWNMLYNAGFDRLQARRGFTRGLFVRALHALGFEIGLLLAIVPLAAWWLDIGLWQAFWLDIGVALFFMPYTFAYNWLYDVLRARIVGRRAPPAISPAAPRPTR